MAKMLATTGSATAAALRPSGLGCHSRRQQPTNPLALECSRGYATLSFAPRRISCHISASLEKGSSWSGPVARRFGPDASSGRLSSSMLVSAAPDDTKSVASSAASTTLETPRLDDSNGGSDGGEGSNNGGGGGGGPDRGGDGNDGDEDGKPSDADVAEVVAAVGNLPKDFQAALKLGTLTMADLKKWQQIRGIPIIGALAAAFQGFRERMMGNPRFLLAVAAEELIGGSAKMAAEVDARKDKFFQELPFVASDMALELICNFTVVWLLSPVRSFTPAPTNGISKALNALPGHFLQVGNFTWGQRIGNLAFRCLQFGTAGIFASAAGHSLVVLSLKNDPKAQEELAPTHKVAFAWGAFMAVSSNIRYQLVNCWEERFLEVLVPNKALNTVVTFVVRFGNCYIGGQQWIWFARQLDLQ